jgi:ribosomal-protein-alanine N-acetyltransferase
MPETERLLLRRWLPSDREPFAALNADARVMEFFPSVLTREQSDAFVDRIEAAFDELDYGLWAIEIKATGTFIGFTGLVLQTFPAHFTPAVEVGWRLAQSSWGNGYASEAAIAALDYGFKTIELEEIVSMTAAKNVRSQRVMQRIGMSRDESDDFLHPNLPTGSPLRPHVLYRIAKPTNSTQ